MLHMMIVDDDPSTARSLADLLRQQQGYSVVGFADDLDSALRVARLSNVHIAFVSVSGHLGGMDSGYLVADELNDLGITCVFLTRTAPPFPIPELAVGWLQEPDTADTVAHSLRLAAADLMAQVGCVSSLQGGNALTGQGTAA